MERTNNALRTPFFFNENNESKKMATVSVAVISGAKFAQPNGVRLKYENVSFTLSVGDVAKIQTAPKGNNSNTIVKAGKTAKQTFFMLYISFTNFDLPITLNNKFHELTTLSKNSLQDSPLYLFLPPELLSEKPTEVPSNSPEERILEIGSLTVACLTSNN